MVIEIVYLVVFGIYSIYILVFSIGNLRKMINMYPEMTKTLFYLCCSCLPASQVL